MEITTQPARLSRGDFIISRSAALAGHVAAIRWMYRAVKPRALRVGLHSV